jgi:mRNA-degrading endonuclease RelE of RelBE toxin-antitoxin system
MKQVLWSEPAMADLASLDKGNVRRIRQAVDRLADSGVGDVKRLQDVDPPALRLRVGDYRAIFRQTELIIRIVRVRHRKEAYR